MSWLPKSPKARRRLWVVAAVAPVLALAVGLSLYAMRDNVTSSSHRPRRRPRMPRQAVSSVWADWSRRAA